MIKIATLNVKGLNNKAKAQKTLTLLKLYNIDIIMIQETNLKNATTRNFLLQQWGFDSFWSFKTAILAGKRNIKLTNFIESFDGRVISANAEIKQQVFSITNIYAPPCPKERVTFFKKWAPKIEKSNPFLR